MNKFGYFQETLPRNDIKLKKKQFSKQSFISNPGITGPLGIGHRTYRGVSVTIQIQVTVTQFLKKIPLLLYMLAFGSSPRIERNSHIIHFDI